MTTRVKLAFVSALLGIGLLAATAGPLSAQEPDAATPAAADAEMAMTMEEMMAACTAMMDMMTAMMGGDMSGMMGGEDMEGMEGMEDMPSVAATPEA